MSCTRTTSMCPRKHCNSCPYNGYQSKKEADMEMNRIDKRGAKQEQTEREMWFRINNNL